MKFVAFVFSFFTTVSAFTRPVLNKGSSVVETELHESKADLVALSKELNPVVNYFDPLNLAEADFWGQGEEATIGFLRHAEIKHGRVAMFAFVGYLVHINGIKWPWPMRLDGTPFPDIRSPPELWDNIPDGGKWQILFLIFFLEFWGEYSTENHKHYMKGGKPGDYPDFRSGENEIPHPVPFNFYDPFKRFKKMSEEKKAERLVTEINNGRLAMIGIFGFLSEQCVTGSVPFLKNCDLPHYDGQVMAPFNENIIGMAFGLK